ncbi:hypothetical protein LAT59_03905 [Candidatus Gracilibacteria bacterium]|nr:hypothetical protein [Candidatus Gracilibacteria bacterium]
MCGLSGILYKDEVFISHSQKLLSPRAINGEDTYISSSISLHHAHLSISDLNMDTRQPYEDDAYIICFVGEIYNREYLVEACGGKGGGNTECQVLSQLFATFGADGVAKINGEFIICLFDKATEITYLFRDRYGTKSLYYTFIDNVLAFSSEMKVLISEETAFSKQGLYDTLIFGYTISPHTLFENIWSIKPGTYLIHDKGDIVIKSYGKYVYTEDNGIIDTIEQAVIRRIPKFQDTILFPLSGGADSNITLYFLKKHFNGEIITYSFLSAINSEDVEYASYNAVIHNCKHYIIPIDIHESTGQDIVHESINNLINIGNVVRSNIAGIEQVKVEFSGDGREELFKANKHFNHSKIISNYNHIRKIYNSESYDITPKFLNHTMFDFNLQLLEKVTLTSGIERRLPFTDYELIRFSNHGDLYTLTVAKLLKDNSIRIVPSTYGHNNAVYFSYPDIENITKKIITLKKSLIL